jgi:hemerythrin-like domain-containing protein
MKTRRRQFLAVGATLGITGLVGGIPGALGAEPKETGSPAKEQKTAPAGEEEEVSPAEDLMREHGVLKRILLIYGEAVRRIDAREDLPPKSLADAAGIIRSFLEDYHSKLEEDFLFPRFRKANKLVDLVNILQEQHQAGRRLTDVTRRLATAQALNSADDRKALAESLRGFVRMYSPHEAREDTVLFPAFHEIVSAHEYGALGEDFEKREHDLFGKDGFEDIVGRVAAIEKTLGIFDLSQFTPRTD